MATGLEILGAVAASIELVRVTKIGLTIFNEFRHTDLIPKEQKELHFRMVTQGLKFEWWCFTLGIQDIIELEETNPKWHCSEDFQQFEATLETELRFSNKEIVRLTVDIVRSMNQKFDEASRIFAKYVESKRSRASERGNRILHFSWGKFSTKNKAELASVKAGYLEASRGFRSSDGASLSSAARWLSVDKSTITQLLSTIESLNGSLIDLLQYNLRIQVSRRTNMAILDNADSHTLVLMQSLPDGSDLKPLASMRRWQIREQKEEINDVASDKSTSTLTTESVNTRIHTYPVEDFKRGTLRIGESRSLSILDDKPAIVEWKYFSKEHPFRVEQSIRLANLVAILNRNDLFNKFLALPCRGLVSDTDNSRIGIVFSTTDSSLVTMATLRDTILSTEKTPPPIGQRFGLARKFSLCLASLHSVRWLHKSIRSDNFICFQQSKIGSAANHPTTSVLNSESTSDVVSSELNSAVSSARPLTVAPQPLPSFFLLGWDLSRPDHPSELSETLSISTQGFQTKREIIQMYSHPDVWLSAGPSKRTTYRPQFDIYSMGLVLLEIGLWRTIDKMWSKCKDDTEFRLRVKTEYCDKLQSRMGLIYWRAVQRCLANDFDTGDKVLSGRTDFHLQVSFEKHVVSELERCCA